MFGLTEQAVAEAVPRARGAAPGPAAPDARGEGEVDPDDGDQEVAQADVDQQQVGRGPEPLEPAVQNQNQRVVPEPEHPDGSDGESQNFVGPGGEDVLPRDRRTPAGSGVVVLIHGADTSGSCMLWGARLIQTTALRSWELGQRTGVKSKGTQRSHFRSAPSK